MGEGLRPAVYVHDGERGAGDLVGAAQPAGDALAEGCFPRAEPSGKQPLRSTLARRSPSAAVSALLPVSYTAMARLLHAVCIKVRAGARIYSILYTKSGVSVKCAAHDMDWKSRPGGAFGEIGTTKNGSGGPLPWRGAARKRVL